MKGHRITLRTLADCRLLAVLLAMAVAPVQAQTRTAAPAVCFQVERFVVESENPLSEERTRAVLAPFTGEHDSRGRPRL